MNLDVPAAPLKEKMLVMKAGNGINAEHVATIVSAMFIAAKLVRMYCDIASP